MVDEEIKTEKADNEQDEKLSDSQAGDEQKTEEQVKLVNAETERINKAVADHEKAKAVAKLSGVADAAIEKPKEPEETPEEYANKILQGRE